LQLASQGVAITVKTELELDGYVARSNRAYEQRLASVRRLSSSDIDAQAKVEFENETAKRANMKEQFELVTLIRELSTFRMQVRENALKQQAQQEKMLEVGEPITVPKAKLADLRKAFAVLSEEISQKEWLKFAFDYGKQVNASLEKLKDSANKAEATAEEEKKKLETREKKQSEQ
jgi:hypothetical protein